MKKIHPAESEYYRKLGKKSAEARRKQIIERSKIKVEPLKEKNK